MDRSAWVRAGGWGRGGEGVQGLATVGEWSHFIGSSATVLTAVSHNCSMLCQAQTMYGVARIRSLKLSQVFIDICLYSCWSRGTSDFRSVCCCAAAGHITAWHQPPQWCVDHCLLAMHMLCTAEQHRHFTHRHHQPICVIMYCLSPPVVSCGKTPSTPSQLPTSCTWCPNQSAV